MQSGINEAVIELIHEFAALLNKANQLLDVVIAQEREEPEHPPPILRRRPGSR